MRLKLGTACSLPGSQAPSCPWLHLFPGPAWQGLADLLGSDLDLFPEPLPQLLRPVFPAQPRPTSLSRRKKTP